MQACEPLEKANSLKSEDAKPPVYGSIPKIAGLPADGLIWSFSA
jgi:hypothetical protein